MVRRGGGRTGGRNGGRKGDRDGENPQPSEEGSVTGSGPTRQGTQTANGRKAKNNNKTPGVDPVGAAAGNPMNGGVNPVMMEQLLQLMGDMKRQNDHLQAQVDFLIQGRTPDDENWRQAAELASF